MPQKRASGENEKQYEALKDKGMSKERAAKIANSPGGGKATAKRASSPSHAPRFDGARRRRLRYT